MGGFCAGLTQATALSWQVGLGLGSAGSTGHSLQVHFHPNPEAETLSASEGLSSPILLVKGNDSPAQVEDREINFIS